MLHQNSRDLFDELMEKLAEKELKNRGLKSDFMHDKILDEMYEKFEYFESEVIKISNGIPIPKRDQ
tara:strand:+ start:26 stop:223 length:198 start_codon:yes stop_codon:yes gene_type:complete